MYDNNFEICDMPLSLKSNRTRVERFLADSGLRLDDVDMPPSPTTMASSLPAEACRATLSSASPWARLPAIRA